ncbi:MAG: MBOAT family protein [Desulfobacteraceae bacterium]|nr:MBOAT family protein [Desulfobacteraceae bacterium]MBC2752737.1 MBOAT family protein [Desulfobacteraceae bacterium]
MLFNSTEFIFYFLPIVLSGFFLIGKLELYRLSVLWLIAASLFFYGWWNPAYLILIIFSISFNFAVGLLIKKKHSKSTLYLICGILINLSLVGYFKYANFFVDNINHITGSYYHLNTIILPLGISFFTFQQIAYIVDVYKGKVVEHNFYNYALFVSFFPQLVAGPIVHHKELLPQFNIRTNFKIDLNNIGFGLTYFFIGLFKKIILADTLALYATPVFTNAESGELITFFVAWSGAIAYTFQLYFDFSGYSDMAIGIAKLFNINLPLNFFSPYKSFNVIEFWNRWHITLSRFLREYVYIPLGGNRKGNIRRYLNLLITMFLCGLWHGAGWTFIIWGILHGFLLLINHFWRYTRKTFWLMNRESIYVGRSFSRFITFNAVLILWVLFRANSFESAKNILQGMMGKNGFVLPAQILNIFPPLQGFVKSVGTMPLLGGGTIMGMVEMLGLFILSFVLINLPATHEMNARLKYFALIGSMYFTIQNIFFGHAPSEFLYFQF